MPNPDPHPTPAENTSANSRMLEGREPDLSVLDQDIDARMAAVLKDHQEMGARPAQEPTTEDVPPAEPDKPAPKKRVAKKAAKKK